MRKKKKTIFNKLRTFYDAVIRNNRNNIKNVRPVYLGIRIRLITYLGLLLLGIMLITLLSFYILQRNAIYREKDNKALSLVQMLQLSAEYYLDKDIHTTRAERQEKFLRIKETCESFMNYNENMYKIVLTDDTGKIRYSTYDKDIGLPTNASYLIYSLENKEEKKYDFKYVDKNQEVFRYRAVSHPIFLTKGSIVTILDDFDLNYEKFHKAKLAAKKAIYLKLWKKYRDSLPADFNPQGAESSKKIVRHNDIDFLFLQLFMSIMKDRQKRAKKGEAYLWKMGWLYDEKNKIVSAYQNNIPENAFEANELIKSRLIYMKEQIDEIRLLGAVAILFDLGMIRTEVNNNIRIIFIVIGVISILALILFSIIISYLIQNIKKLEKGAMLIGQGDFDNRISIKTADETGRLSDILNNMAVQLKDKLHMEKFVSKTTKKMITDSRNFGKDITPGSVYKAHLSFIFADVRGFTSFSENHEPTEVVDTLNLYFDLQYKVVRRYKGDVDDYVGDQVMAHFSGNNNKERSCKAAIDMMKEVHTFNAKRKKAKLPYFEIGIGVHSGTVVIGNIGSKARMDFACVGDGVNTTSRLCSKANPGTILVSREHIEDIKNRFVFSSTPSVEAKGKKEKIRVYKLVDLK